MSQKKSSEIQRWTWTDEDLVKAHDGEVVSFEDHAAHVARLTTALEKARHELATMNGLSATDRLDAYGDALSDGCDANGAWDAFRELVWSVDTTKAIAAIDEALARPQESDKLAKELNDTLEKMGLGHMPKVEVIASEPPPAKSEFDSRFVEEIRAQVKTAPILGDGFPVYTVIKLLGVIDQLSKQPTEKSEFEVHGHRIEQHNGMTWIYGPDGDGFEVSENTIKTIFKEHM